MKFLQVLLIFFFLVSVSIVGVIADSGETDEKGGHYNRKTGEYHIHIDPNENKSALRQLQAIRLQATTDAKRDSSLGAINTWYFMGLCLGPFGIATAFVIQPKVPAHRLLGKSPEYVSIYTEVYKREMKNQRVKSASIGFAVFGCLYFGDQFIW